MTGFSLFWQRANCGCNKVHLYIFLNGPSRFTRFCIFRSFVYFLFQSIRDRCTPHAMSQRLSIVAFVWRLCVRSAGACRWFRKLNERFVWRSRARLLQLFCTILLCSCSPGQRLRAAWFTTCSFWKKMYSISGICRIHATEGMSEAIKTIIERV